MSRKPKRSGCSSRKQSRLNLEPLEPRVLLTTIGVGDWFVFRGSDVNAAFDGELIRVEVSNNVTGVGRIEILGENPVTGEITDIPGLLNGTTVVAGGIAGEDCGTAVPQGTSGRTGQDEILATAIDSTGFFVGFANSVRIDDNPNTTYPPATLPGVDPPPPDPYEPYDAAVLVSINYQAGTTQVLGIVQDDYGTNPLREQIAFDQVVASDFDEYGSLWAIALTEVDKLPPDPQATPPQTYLPDMAVTGTEPLSYLIRIDDLTPQALTPTRDAIIVADQYTLTNNNDTITSIVWDVANDQFYAADSDDNHLKIIDVPPPGQANAVIRDVAPFFTTGNALQGVTGLEIDDEGTMYGTAGGSLYEIDPVPQVISGWNNDNPVILCTMTGQIGFDELQSLAFDPNQPEFMWSVNAETDADTLVRIVKKPPKPTEIYSMYIPESDAYTEIKTAVVIPYQAGGRTQYDDARLWNSGNTPYLGTIGNTAYFAPSGSGGVLIGGEHAPGQDRPFRFAAITDEFPVRSNVGPHGVFPGGDLPAGIHVVAPQDVSGLVETVGIIPWLDHDAVGSLAIDSAGNFFGVDAATTTLLAIDPVTGTSTVVGPLAPGYANVNALDFDAGDVLWGVGDDATGVHTLLQIDPATGIATPIAPVAYWFDPDEPIEITTVAFDAGGTLYAIDGVDPATAVLGTIDLVTGEFTTIGWCSEPGTFTPIGGMTGIEFDANGMLHGIAEGQLYQIDETNADCIAVLPTGAIYSSALAFDPNQPEYLWAINSLAGPDKLVRIQYSALTTTVGTAPTFLGRDDVLGIGATGDGDFYGVDNDLGQLISIDPTTGVAATIGPLPAGYTVTGMDLRSSSELWACGTNNAGDPVIFRFQYTGTNFTSTIVESHDVDPVTTSLSSITFNDSGVMYGVDTSLGALVTIDRLSGITNIQAFLTAPGITGIDFAAGGLLYGVDDSSLYEINPITGTCTLLRITPFGDLEALAFTASDPHNVYAVNSPGGVDQLVKIHLGFGGTEGEVGYLMIGGTVAGRATVPNSVEIFQLGFLYGNIDIGGDLRTLWAQTDAGGVAYGAYQFPLILNPFANSEIHVAGTLGDAYIGQDLYANVVVEGKLGIPDPDLEMVDWNRHAIEPLLELEGRVPEVLGNRAAFSIFDGFRDIFYYEPAIGEPEPGAFIYAPFMPLNPGAGSQTVTNDTFADAQYLASETGDIIFWGVTYDDQSHNVDHDYYALPLMAGQTVRIQAFSGHLYDPMLTHVNDPREGIPYDTYFPFRVYAPDRLGTNEYVATFGYETVEDQGFNSRGTVQEPLEFTAPAAGLYYIEIWNPSTLLEYGPYTIYIDGAAPTTLGALDVRGTHTPWYTVNAPELAEVYVSRGNMGTLNSESSIMGVSVNIERGAIYDVQAEGVGHQVTATGEVYAGTLIQAARDVGRVHSRSLDLYADIIAGADTGAPYDNDAVVQNVSAAGDLVRGFVGSVVSSGSIGRVRSGNDVYSYYTIQANYDGVGPASTIDIIDVAGSWGTGAPPSLLHGVDGNVRFMQVLGDYDANGFPDIYVEHGGYIGLLNPTIIEGSGALTTFTDDGGGELRIYSDSRVTTTTATVPDPNDPTGGTITTTVTVRDYTNIAYLTVPVDDAVGGVLAYIKVDGPMHMENLGNGVVEVGRLELTNTQPGDDIEIDGGRVDVYHVFGTEIDTFINDTRGDIVSGDFQGVRILETGGSIGYTRNGTGADIPGAEAAPSPLSAPDILGWFEGRLNGVQFRTDVEEITAGGAIRDLFIIGTAGTITANANGVTPAGGWDGVRGVIYATTRVEEANLGDGLADDGPGYRVQAALLTDGSFGTIRVDRRYEVIGGVEFGLVNGSILAVGDTLDPVTGLFTRGVGSVIGTRGARLTAIIAGAGLYNYQCFGATAIYSAPVGTVHFSGNGAQIFRAEVFGSYIGTVKTSNGSLGIVESYITGSESPAGIPSIDLIEADGPGILRNTIGANGGVLREISAVGPQADIIENYVETTDDLMYLSARHIYGNDFDVPLIMHSIRTRGNFSANSVDTGSLGRGLTIVNGDMLGNVINVAGPVQAIKVGGVFSSTLTLQGPEVAYLKLLEARGEVGGSITSAGRIVTIRSKTSNITADIRTTEEAINGDIHLVDAALAFTGSLWSSGDVNLLRTRGHVGLDPSTKPDFEPTVIDIQGDFKKLDIIRRRNDPAWHLYSNLNIGGDGGTLLIDGGFYGDMRVNGNVTKLAFQGDLGQTFMLGDPAVPVMRGNVEVRGYVKNLVLSPGSDLNGNIVTGGDAPRIKLTDGDIHGAITSLFGDVPYIQVIRGSIMTTAAISADMNVGQVHVIGTTLAPETIDGAITAVNGGVDLVYAKNATVNGAVTAGGGPVESVQVINGSLNAPVTAMTSVDRIKVTNGNVTAPVTAGTELGLLDIRNGSFTSMASAETGINKIFLASDIDTAVIRSGGPIGSITADWIRDSIISAATDIDVITARDGIDNTLILGGYDVGLNGAIGGGDDNPYNAGNVHSGSTKRVKVGGAFTNSVLALGVDPGGSGDYFNLGDNVAAPGYSALTKLTGARNANYAGSLVVADSSTGNTPAGLPTDTVDVPGPGINPANAFGTGFARTRQFNVFGVTLTAKLTGPGVASFDDVTGDLVINDTTSATTITLKVPNGAVLPVDVTVASNDDAGLKALNLSRGITLGDVAIDGPVGTIKTYDLATTVALPGGVKTFINYGTAALTGLNFTAGEVGKFYSYGAVLSGNVTVDSAKIVEIRGDMGADFAATLGGVNTYRIRGGDQNGDFTSRGDVKLLDIINVNPGGALHGNVNVTHGDVKNIKADSDVSANVDILRGGLTGMFEVRNGDFGNTADPQDLNALRTLSGVHNFRVVGGDYYGMVWTQHEVDTFRVLTSSGVGGLMNGRVLGLDGIGSLVVQEMRFGLAASGGDFRYAKVNRDMIQSYLLAGFDPGQDGYEVDHNMDDVWLDPFTFSSNNTVPEDTVRGGTFVKAIIRGDMDRSAVAAGVGPGEDGYIGNDDDVVAGTGYLRTALVNGRIYGSGGGQSYGFSAATEVGNVRVNGQPFAPLPGQGNVGTVERVDPVGPPRVLAVTATDDGVEIQFSQPIDTSTLITRWTSGQTSSIELIVSRNSIFGDADDINVTTYVPHIVHYDDSTNSVTVQLKAETWQDRDDGTNFLLTLDGDVISDASGLLLDGEYDNWFPSGDNKPGGDFVYRFHYGDHGEYASTALDLTKDDDKAILIHNQPLALPGEIGDNPDFAGALRASEVDVFRIDANQGDILYVAVDNPFLWDVDVFTTVSPPVLSRTGQGYFTPAATETYFIEVSSFLDSIGSYELYVHLFNDGNSDFKFVELAPNATGFNDVASLGTSAAGAFYAVDNDTGQLVQIDPVTGLATAVGATGAYVTAADYDSTGDLWAIGDGGAVPATVPEIWYYGVANDTFGAWGLSPVNSQYDVADMYEALTASPTWSQTTVNARIDSNVTGQGILSGLDWLVANAQAGDLVFWHYSGHGDTSIQDVDDDEPVILDPNDPLDPNINTTPEDESIGLNAQPNDWITDDDIADVLTGLDPAANLVIVFDSCHSGGMTGGLEDLNTLPNVYVMMSSLENESSWDTWSGGRFTQSLVDGISGFWPADANFDNMVTLDEWFDYAASDWTVLGWQTPENFDATGGALGSMPIIATAPPPAGMTLSTLDTTTGAATVEVASTELRNAQAIAFDVSDTLYAINADTNWLVTVDTTTGAVTPVGMLANVENEFLPFVEPITAIEFVDGTLYGTNGYALYEIDTFTGYVQTASYGLGVTDITALSYDPTTPDVLWAISNPAGGPAQLISVNLGFGNSDSSQTPTLLDFNGNIAQPDDVDAEGFPVQVITAPDDVDVYSLGDLAEGTPISVTLLTRTIGSPLEGLAAIFNSDGELISSIGLPAGAMEPDDFGVVADDYTDDPLAFGYAPADDTYYVAIWGGDMVNPFAPGLAYDLTVEIGTPIVPVPVPPSQHVYLNFLGGQADYLAQDYPYGFGPGYDSYLDEFVADIFGFDTATATDDFVLGVVEKVEAMYSAYGNITFSTQQPYTGNYSEVIITGEVAPVIGLYGIADGIDNLNSDPNDMAVVFAGELASNWHFDLGYSMEDLEWVVANVVTHELGHILGLMHQVELYEPPYLIMAYDWDDVATTQQQVFGTGELVDFLIGYQNDDVLLRVIA